VQTYVSVLHEEDGELKQIGQVGGMGHGEQIRSVRFIGSMGYVVTFKQTDPLYTVDIRDPHHPKVAGELSLLGYSAYLHPVANGLIMGVGQDATSQGRALGTQVTLFDVSNPSHPELVQKVAMPGGSSTVEQDYHAFLWWDPSHLAFIPVQQYGGVARTQPACMPDSPCAAEADAPTAAFVGVVGMTVDSSGIHETGRIVNPGATTPGIPECPPDADCATSGSSGSSGTVGTAVVPPSIATTSTTVPSDPELRTACEASGQCATTTSSTPTTAPTSSTEPELTAPSTTMRCDPACPKPTDPPSTSTSTSQAPGSSTSSSSASSSTTVATPAPSTTLRPVPSIPAGGGAPIDRTVVVGDHVLTVSAGGIVVSDLGDLAPITWVPFA
jgi:hypothetical protein